MVDAVITLEVPSLSSPSNLASRIICRVCQKQFSQYTCPRCNCRYCSIQCYKSHSLRCTESFMRENVIDELRHIQPDDQTKRKMADILMQFHLDDEADNSMNEDDSSLSEATMEKILSGAQVSLGDLSAVERKRFQRALVSGELSKFIEPWEPWWSKPSARALSLSPGGCQLVQPLTVEQNGMPGQDDCSTEIPPGPETPLPPTAELSSARPSPLLAVHLVDVLYSYCFTLRLYNGECHADPAGSAMAALSMSSVLSQARQLETVPEALSHCLEQTCSPANRQMGGLQFGFGLVHDVMSLLSLGGSALICALCDLRRLIQHGARELRSEKPRMAGRVKAMTKFRHAERKVYFMMCWMCEQPSQAWSSLADMVGGEKASLECECHENNFGRQGLRPENRGKALIQELQ